MARDDPSLVLPDPATNVEGSNGRSRRLFRRLCLLLLVMIVVPVVIIGYRYQQQLAFIERCGNSGLIFSTNVRTTPRGSDWLREKVGEERMRGFEDIIAVEDLHEATEEDLKFLSGSPIRDLHLFETKLTSFGMKFLGKTQQLEQLELGRCAPISVTLFEELADLNHLTGLHFTNSMSATSKYRRVTKISGKMIFVYSTSKSTNRIPLDSSLTLESLRPLRKMPRLRSLTFRGMELTDDYLVEIGKLHQLELLDLCDTSITDEGVSHLAQLTNLKVLKLAKTSVGDQGVKYFLNHTALQRFELEDTKLTFGGLTLLRKSLPDCEVKITTTTPVEFMFR